jgi:hypothetical protein
MPRLNWMEDLFKCKCDGQVIVGINCGTAERSRRNNASGLALLPSPFDADHYGKMSSDGSVNLDEVIVIGLEPQTWYSFVQGQLELLRSHVQEREKQIDESVKAYEKGKRGTDVEEDDDGYPIVILEEYGGIEGPANELQEIFEYYYPNLQRRSMLIILFSFFERQLDQLCQLFAKEQQLSITHADLKGKGIDRTRLYLQKVIGLPLTASVTWQEIKRIQRVRNVVVHNDAKLLATKKTLSNTWIRRMSCRA